jgi:hypothetical protein
MGVDASAISWVRPRETWMVNRASTQPGAAFAGNTVGWQLEQMRSAATATSGDDIFLHLEEHGHMLRLDRSILPTKFHFPTISQGEVNLLRSIDRVLKIGRISHIEPGTLHGADSDATVPEHALFIDCTATAAPRKAVALSGMGAGSRRNCYRFRWSRLVLRLPGSSKPRSKLTRKRTRWLCLHR